MAETKSKNLTEKTIKIPQVYAPVFQSEYQKFLLSSGRLSGKTSVLVIKWWERTNSYPDRDIVILQATATEMKDSIINEIEKFLRNSGFDVGDDVRCEWYIPKAHDTVIHRGQVGRTYIRPITDSKGGQRSRGIATTNPISLVLYEEAQKNKDANVIEQSVITFMRQLDDNAQMIIAGNNETIGHWFIDYVNEKRLDPSWKYIYANCFDIWELLNSRSQDEVMALKNANPTEFRRIYLGDVSANTSDVVFPQFDRKTCYKRVYEIPIQYIRTLIIGIDHATANDTFAVVPVAVLEDGTTQTLEVCYDDPSETNRTLAPTEQCAILDEFINFLDSKYAIADNRLDTYLSVDGAAAPFIAQLEHLKRTAKNRKLWSGIQIKKFTMKKKDANLGIIKNAFAFRVLTILNEGVKDWRGDLNKHRLCKEIERQRYKNGKLDPHIPNDLCDALEYGLIPYYTNCYNISLPIRRHNGDHYDEIRKLAGVK